MHYQSNHSQQQQFDFISYVPTPEDGQQVGIATIRINGPTKIIMRYKWVMGKDGKGTFPAMASVCHTRNAEKKYLNAAQLDSSSDNDMLQDFIRENVKRFTSGLGSSSGLGNSPHVCSNPPPTSMSEVSANEQLPF